MAEFLDICTGLTQVLTKQIQLLLENVLFMRGTNFQFLANRGITQSATEIVHTKRNGVVL